MKKWQKYTKRIFWGVFLTWNAVLLFVVAGKKDPAQITTEKAKTEQTATAQTGNIIAPTKQMQTNTTATAEKLDIETAKSNYEFVESKLTKVTLKDYKAKVDSDQKMDILDNETIQIKWVGNTHLPDSETVWTKKIEENKITFAWKNNENVVFLQTWEFDENYGVKVAIDIHNHSNRTINVMPSIEMKKNEFEKHQSFIFSGISIYSDKKLHNLTANSSNNKQLSTQSDSWAAFNQKYWLIACNKPDFGMVAYEKNDNAINEPHTLTYKSTEICVTPQDQKQTRFNLYIGPKEVKNLKQFGATYNVPNIENAIDYGWLFFLTKPVNYILNLLISKISSIALALVVLTLLLKLMTWPFTKKSHIATKRIHELTPAVNDIKHRLKDNPQLMNKEIFALYKKYDINPVSGCLPSFLQMLFLFPLYKVLSFSIDMRFASFPGWIKDLSAQDPTSWMNLFGLLPYSAPDFLHIGIWPILMGLTMLVQQNLTSAGPQTNEQKFMLYGLPVLFTWMMSNLATGVVIYWTITNILTVLQIMLINRSENKKGKLNSSVKKS